MKFFSKFALVTLVFQSFLFGPNVQAESEISPLTGRIFSDLYLPTSQIATDSFQQVSATFWLQADPKLSPDTWAHLTFVGNEIASSNALNATIGFEGSIREVYVESLRTGWSFKVGKMIIPWGKSDGINPMDWLTAKDYPFFNPDEEVRRIGGVSAMATYTPNSGLSPWTFTFVGTPVFARSRLLLAPGQIPSNVSGVATVSAPVTNLANSETAFKVAYAGNDWDVGLAFFRGFNHLPQMEFVSSSGALPNLNIQVQQSFQRIRSLGLEGSVTWGNWILRSESSYTWTDNDRGYNPLLKPSHFDTVFGVERKVGDDFRVQAQVLVRYFPGFVAPNQLSHPNPATQALLRQVAELNGLIQNYQDSVRPATTLRISYSNEDSGISAEIFGIGNVVGGGGLIKPKVSYDWSESLVVSLGVDHYFGPQDRPLGVLRPYNAIYSEVKYSF